MLAAKPEENLVEIVNNYSLDVIPQPDGSAEIKLGECPPVVFRMLDTGKVETKLLAPGEPPPPKVHHP